jgi:hypothetical protein
VIAGVVRERPVRPLPKTPAATGRAAEAGPRREYLYIDQLAELTPWSPQRIRGMIHEGQFVEGVHFFRPKGARTRPVFSWEAVVRYIEGERVGQKPMEALDETARAVHALLD